MSRRFGRNQKREARATIARLASEVEHQTRRQHEILAGAGRKIAELEGRLRNAIEFRVSLCREPINMTHRARLDVVKGEAIVSADVAWTHDELREWLRYERPDEMHQRVAAALTNKMMRGIL